MMMSFFQSKTRSSRKKEQKLSPQTLCNKTDKTVHQINESES